MDHHQCLFQFKEKRTNIKTVSGSKKSTAFFFVVNNYKFLTCWKCLHQTWCSREIRSHKSLLESNHITQLRSKTCPSLGVTPTLRTSLGGVRWQSEVRCQWGGGVTDTSSWNESPLQVCGLSLRQQVRNLEQSCCSSRWPRGSDTWYRSNLVEVFTS